MGEVIIRTTAHDIVFCSQNFTSISFQFQTVKHNAYGEDKYAKEFGIKISANLAQVEARILPPPRVS